MSTKIGWTDETWNAVRGCSRVSDGCLNCYAMGQAHRFSGPGKPYEGLTTIRRGKVDWTGVARLVPSMLDAPLHWRKPRRIFVNSMSDLFHHSLTNEEIGAVFAVMSACPQHTFQILTKRPDRMLAWFKWNEDRLGEALARDQTRAAKMMADFCFAVRDIGSAVHAMAWSTRSEAWPLPNVHLGVSVENQPTADERIPVLLDCPAAVHFVSAEPLLGSLSLAKWLAHTRTIHLCVNISGSLRRESNLDMFSADGVPLSRAEVRRELERLQATGARVIRGDASCDNFDDQQGCLGHENKRLDWVIVGGESGNGARPFDIGWARSIRDECRVHGVPLFMKQLGAKPYDGKDVDFGEMGWLGLADRSGSDWDEWPPDLRVQEFPEART